MQFTDRELALCYRFSQEMIGNHNKDIIMEREDWEIFRDDFRGKLGEVALRKYITENVPNANIEGDIDYSVTPLGQWDTVDLQVNGIYINVKSVKQKSNFLMIEKKRYNADGQYSYKNNNGKEVQVDAYVLVRVTVEPDMTMYTMGFTDIEQLKENRVISAEILGGISHDEFWSKKHYISKGIRCTYYNLRAACDEKEVFPEQGRGSEKKTEILQQDNYILYKDELKSIADILNRK
jgi:hypothetical protein|uniref:hypothetical protein n=1 Tax=Enterocloster clostridioformis TaxID=1531 RepID=UPI00206D408F|nr:MAG TPA: hypothetical protein [Caudoviricetes sp.]